MVTQSRWKAAQEYERGYWAAQAAQIAEGTTSQLEWYRWRAGQLTERLEALGLHHLTSGDARVVEVGSGPIGVANFFSARERVAVDPLEEFYGADPVLTRLRDPGVQFRQGVGEALPCETGQYDLALIENCIDHVRDMDAVMQELRRVLGPDGILFLTVNNRSRWGFVVHRILSRLKIDAGHPHTMTPPRTERLIRRNGFEILRMEIGSYADAKREDWQSGQARARIKALIGVSEYLVSVVARRTA